MGIEAAGVMGWVLSLLTGLAVLAAVYAILPPVTQQNLEPASHGKGRWRGQGAFLRYFGWLIELLGKGIARLPLNKSRAKLKEKLAQAGKPGGLSPDEFQATRIISIAALGGIGYFFDQNLALTPLLTLLLGLLGVVYPYIWLNGCIKKRRRRIFRDLPDLLDILRLATSAGLDFGSALSVVVEKGRQGPLLHELELVDRDISLGLTRGQALQNMADRLGMSDINSFVLALRQADELGASIGPILEIQSAMARQRRWQAAEVVVNKLPMKMLGPLVIFIFPASFIILFVPLAIQYMQSGF